MIGVLAKPGDREVIEEFFQLFKTPWEFYVHGRNYSVILSTQSNIPEMGSKLVIIYGNNESPFDNIEGVRIKSKLKNISVEYDGVQIPIYGDILTFEEMGETILRVKCNLEVSGLKIESSQKRITVLGYNLFEEIYYLLSVGQPKVNAHIPTIEMHITLLRNLIVEAGIPLIEIPPVPAGFEFITCLTHDIDFAGIRKHKFDHTLFGFLYRASVGSLVLFIEGKLSLQKLLKNWNAVLRLPLVYLGVSKDFWLQFDSYAEIEKDHKSTFFFVPFKKRHGDGVSENRGKRRATKYDISDVKDMVQVLAKQGFEIGVHGIDAWHDAEKGRLERDRVVETYKGKEVGVRIHWLLFNEDSYRKLEEAGFSYDSTCGYNEAIGYRAGTLQVFKPLGTKRLLELPLHIQDTALFYPGRMNLSENKALELCEKLIQDAKAYKGVLTILWHDRSLAPERLWGEFYFTLLNKIMKNHVWFATAGEIVNWFRRRREVIFEGIDRDDDKIRFSLKYDRNGSVAEKEPFLFVRIYHPKLRNSNKQNPSSIDSGHIDIPLKGQTSFEIPLAT